MVTTRLADNTEHSGRREGGHHTCTHVGKYVCKYTLWMPFMYISNNDFLFDHIHDASEIRNEAGDSL